MNEGSYIGLHAIYIYRDVVTAGHTKPFLNDFGIPTVHGVMVYAHKWHFLFALPHAVREWLTNFNDHIYRNSLLFKGPLILIILEL